MPSEELFYCRYKSILISFQQICKSEAVTQVEPYKNHVGRAISTHQHSRYKLNSHSMSFVAQSNVCLLLVE